MVVGATTCEEELCWIYEGGRRDVCLGGAGGGHGMGRASGWMEEWDVLCEKILDVACCGHPRVSCRCSVSPSSDFLTRNVRRSRKVGDDEACITS
jgi:hypothetical protein